MSSLELIRDCVIAGDAKNVKEYTESAIAEGLDVAIILNDGLIAGMNTIGARFKDNKVYIPEVLISARAMHMGMDVIKPLLATSGVKDKGTVVIGTVKGDMHDIGKKLVIMVLEGAGYRVIDLGIDVPTDKFLQAVEEHRPQVVGMSALLTTTMTQMKITVQQLKSFDGKVKTIVGGAPVTVKFAQEIGADGYAADAVSSVDKVAELIAR